MEPSTPSPAPDEKQRGRGGAAAARAPATARQPPSPPQQSSFSVKGASSPSRAAAPNAVASSTFDIRSLLLARGVGTAMAGSSTALRSFLPPGQAVHRHYSAKPTATSNPTPSPPAQKPRPCSVSPPAAPPRPRTQLQSARRASTGGIGGTTDAELPLPYRSPSPTSSFCQRLPHQQTASPATSDDNKPSSPATASHPAPTDSQPAIHNNAPSPRPAAAAACSSAAARFNPAELDLRHTHEVVLTYAIAAEDQELATTVRQARLADEALAAALAAGLAAGRRHRTTAPSAVHAHHHQPAAAAASSFVVVASAGGARSVASLVPMRLPSSGQLLSDDPVVGGDVLSPGAAIRVASMTLAGGRGAVSSRAGLAEVLRDHGGGGDSAGDLAAIMAAGTEGSETVGGEVQQGWGSERKQEVVRSSQEQQLEAVDPSLTGQTDRFSNDWQQPTMSPKEDSTPWQQTKTRSNSTDPEVSATPSPIAPLPLKLKLLQLTPVLSAAEYSNSSSDGAQATSVTATAKAPTTAAPGAATTGPPPVSAPLPAISEKSVSHLEFSPKPRSCSASSAGRQTPHAEGLPLKLAAGLACGYGRGATDPIHYARPTGPLQGFAKDGARMHMETPALQAAAKLLLAKPSSGHDMASWVEPLSPRRAGMIQAAAARAVEAIEARRQASSGGGGSDGGESVAASAHAAASQSHAVALAPAAVHAATPTSHAARHALPLRAPGARCEIKPVASDSSGSERSSRCSTPTCRGGAALATSPRGGAGATAGYSPRAASRRQPQQQRFGHAGAHSARMHAANGEQEVDEGLLRELFDELSAGGGNGRLSTVGSGVVLPAWDGQGAQPRGSAAGGAAAMAAAAGTYAHQQQGSEQAFGSERQGGVGGSKKGDAAGEWLRKCVEGLRSLVNGCLG